VDEGGPGRLGVSVAHQASLIVEPINLVLLILLVAPTRPLLELVTAVLLAPLLATVQFDFGVVLDSKIRDLLLGEILHWTFPLKVVITAGYKPPA